MIELQEKENYHNLKNNLKTCINIHQKKFQNKELILSLSPIKKQIGLITNGKAIIMKTDINGNTIIIRELKENDIFSNLFFNDSEDEIYIISENTTEVMFIDYYNILNCHRNCPFHQNLILFLFDLLINDNKEQNEKIELLSKRTVRDKFLFFLKKRSKNNKFKVTTSYTKIANYLCVDRSNLMRELSKMEQKKIIKKEEKTIYLLEKETKTSK